MAAISPVAASLKRGVGEMAESSVRSTVASSKRTSARTRLRHQSSVHSGVGVEIRGDAISSSKRLRGERCCIRCGPDEERILYVVPR